MSDKEKAALEWLETMGAHPANIDAVLKIKAMLAEPRLPEEPSDELLRAMKAAYSRTAITATGTGIVAAYRALYAFLTAPRTKEVWRVQPEGWPFEDFTAIYAATARAGHWLAQDIEVSIRKTTVRT